DYHGKGQHEILPFQYAGIFTYDHALSHTQQTEGFMRPVNKEGDRRSNQDTAQSVKATHLEYDLADIFFSGTNRFENAEMIAFFYDNHPDASHQIERYEDNRENDDDVTDPFLDVHQFVQILVLLVLVLNPDWLICKDGFQITPDAFFHGRAGQLYLQSVVCFL